MPKKRIKSPKVSVRKINPKTGTRKDIIDYPVFCFKYLDLTKNRKEDYKFYLSFVERLQKIASQSWNQINTSDKHSFGTEKIPVSQIKPILPTFVTPDVKHLTVFRASGDNRAFLGLRNGIIFHVLFIEEKFGDVYNHGKDK